MKNMKINFETAIPTNTIKIDNVRQEPKPYVNSNELKSKEDNQASFKKFLKNELTKEDAKEKNDLKNVDISKKELDAKEDSNSKSEVDKPALQVINHAPTLIIATNIIVQDNFSELKTATITALNETKDNFSIPDTQLQIPFSELLNTSVSEEQGLPVQMPTAQIEVPKEQGLQVQVPTAKIEVPKEQGLQVQVPTVQIEVPKEQGLQVQVPTAKIEVPKEQGLQVQVPTAKIEVPKEQGLQVQVPTVQIEVPKEQGLQVQVPTAKIEVPKEQGLPVQMPTVQIEVPKEQGLPVQVPTAKIEVPKEQGLPVQVPTVQIEVPKEQGLPVQIPTVQIEVLKQANKPLQQEVRQVEIENKNDDEVVPLPTTQEEKPKIGLKPSNKAMTSVFTKIPDAKALKTEKKTTQAEGAKKSTLTFAENLSTPRIVATNVNNSNQVQYKSAKSIQNITPKADNQNIKNIVVQPKNESLQVFPKTGQKLESLPQPQLSETKIKKSENSILSETSQPTSAISYKKGISSKLPITQIHTKQAIGTKSLDIEMPLMDSTYFDFAQQPNSPTKGITVQTSDIGKKKPEFTAINTNAQPLFTSQIIQAINEGVAIHYSQIPALVQELIATNRNTPGVLMNLNITLIPENLGKVNLTFSLLEEKQINIAIETISASAQKILDTYFADIRQVAAVNGFAIKNFSVKVNPSLSSQSKDSGTDAKAGKKEISDHRSKRRKSSSEDGSIDSVSV